jgi:hypothetical protein
MLSRSAQEPAGTTSRLLTGPFAHPAAGLSEAESGGDRPDRRAAIRTHETQQRIAQRAGSSGF